MKILIAFYSMYGHIFELSQSIEAGAKSVPGITVQQRRIPETIPIDDLKKSGAYDSYQKIEHIPECKVSELSDYSAIIFGTPTRYGNMCAQMRTFLDQTGGLWQKNALVGKVGSVFTSSSTQHGGQESTILSFHITLLHLGMVIVGLPYSFSGQTTTKEICGCSPYGSSTIAGSGNERKVSEIEKQGAYFQGKHVASIAKKLS